MKNKGIVAASRKVVNPVSFKSLLSMMELYPESLSASFKPVFGKTIKT